MKISNYYVDLNGRTYRVALSDTMPEGRPMLAFRQHLNHDHGAAIALDGRIGRKLVALARAEHIGRGR